jgi:hypothetical protein
MKEATQAQVISHQEEENLEEEYFSLEEEVEEEEKLDVTPVER